MPHAELKRFSQPDEVREFPKGRLELVTVGNATIGRAIFGPGWRWASSVQPLVRTKSCQAPHFQYHASGVLMVRMDDGTELECRPGDVSFLPTGHDAWTVGDEPAVVVDFQGMVDYAQQKAHEAEVALEREAGARKAVVEVQRSLSLLGVAISASRKFLDQVSLNDGLRDWLNCLADAVGADRGIWGHFAPLSAPPYGHPVHQMDWSRDGKALDHSIPPASDGAIWVEMLLRNEVVWASRDELQDPVLIQRWIELQIMTSIIVPVFVGGSARGWLSLDFKERRETDDAVIQMLRIAADAAGAAITRDEIVNRSQEAVLEERVRIARDIHDTIAQGSLGVVIGLRALSADAECPGNLGERLKQIGTLAEANLAQARDAIRSIRPGGVNQTEFSKAIETLIASARLEHPALIKLTLPQPLPVLPHEVSEQMLRIAQEAFRNAIRHSAARNICMEVDAVGAGGLRIIVRDDGIGFCAEGPKAGRWGIIGMQERARRIRANLTLASEPGRGTEVILNWSPLSADKP